MVLSTVTERNGDGVKGKRLASLLLALLLVLACCPVLSAQAADNGDYTREDIAWYMDGIVSWCAKRLGVSEDAILSTRTAEYAAEGGLDWYALYMYRAGYESDYAAYGRALEEAVSRKYQESGGLDRIRASEWHRTGLVATACGGDALAFGTNAAGEAVNLVADGVYDRGKTEDLGAQGINGLTWGLLLLDSRGYSVPAGAADTRETILTRILSAQSAEHGFSLSGEGVSADLTAMTLQALAPYQNSTHVFTVTDKATGTTVERTVSEAIELALGALSACQMENGGFGDDGESSESASQAIIALCALGIDPASDARFVKRGGSVLDALLRFAKPDGGFAHTLEKGADGSNAMAGEQALGALTAYMRYKDGLHSLYDLREEADAETAEAVRALREEIDALAAAGTEPDAATAAELQARYDAIPAGERRYVFNYTYLLRWERALGMDIEEPFYDPAEEVPAAEKLDVRTAGTAWSTRFTAADAAVCAALPSPATLADADTVALLLDKLGDTDSAWRTALLEKETEIAAQRQEVAAINARIAGELFPAEKLGAGDRAALEEVIAEIEALPEANRAYVTGAGGLYAARERLNRTQTGRTVGIIAAAAAVIAAAAIVLIIIKKKKAASHTEEIKTKETGK